MRERKSKSPLKYKRFITLREIMQDQGITTSRLLKETYLLPEELANALSEDKNFSSPEKETHQVLSDYFNMPLEELFPEIYRDFPDMLYTEDAPSQEDTVYDNDKRELVRYTLCLLDYREEMSLRKRYGFSGDCLNKSPIPYRIRKYCYRAINKLRQDTIRVTKYRENIDGDMEWTILNPPNRLITLQY